MELTHIQQKIYEVRAQKVMLDLDLSSLFEVETRRLNEQVRRNIERFPADFMFQLSKAEWETLKSQFATSSWGDTGSWICALADTHNSSQFVMSSRKHRSNLDGSNICS